MKRIFAFLTAANQVLLFIGALAALVLLGMALVQELRPRGTDGVPVRDASEKPAPPEITSVDFLTRSHGFALFGVRKDYVGKETPELAAHAGKITSSSYHLGMSHHLNVIFSDGTRVRRHLLPQDGMILRHAFASEEDEERRFKAHVFHCVLTDTNHDGMLGYNDSAALLIVRPDLSGENLRIDDVRDFTVLSRDELLVETGTGAQTRFWIVDAATFDRREVAWQ